MDPRDNGHAVAEVTVGNSLSMKDVPGQDECGQHGEISALFEHLAYFGIENNWVVEVGANDGKFYSNSLAFRRRGWNALLIEADHAAVEKLVENVGEEPNTDVRECKVGLDEDARLDTILVSAGVPKEFDVLSIDVDGMDYHIFKSLERYTPRFVIIETTDEASVFAECRDFVPPYGEEPEQRVVAEGFPPHCKLCGRQAMVDLAREKGYQVVGASRINLILAHESVLATKPVKLNLGSGMSSLPGFRCVDAMFGDRVFPLDFPDNSVDTIYASHVLEHFSHRNTLEVLAEWKRALKPWGTLRVAVPDWDKIKDGSQGWNWTESVVMGSHTDRFDRHGALFTKQKLEAQLHYLGFENVKPFKSPMPDCSRYEFSLNLESQKRAFTVKEKFRTVAVISQPRITYTDGMRCLHRALRTLAVKREKVDPAHEPIVDDLIDCGGAYWEKYITGGIKAALKTCGPGDYLLFTDNDSVFDPEDVLALIDHLQNNPEDSVAFAVQVSRHHDNPLVHMPHINYDGEATPVQLAHFGLTVVRAEVFRYIPKPWLWSMPNPETGEWDTNGHCDADITFWRVLKEFGHNVVQVNSIQAGHMDLCVKWLTDKGIMYQPISHYKKHGKPAAAKFNPVAHKPLSPLPAAAEPTAAPVSMNGAA